MTGHLGVYVDIGKFGKAQSNSLAYLVFFQCILSSDDDMRIGLSVTTSLMFLLEHDYGRSL